MNEPLSTKLRRLRDAKGWTLKEAAEASGVHPSYLSSIENRRRAAGLETVSRLANAYAPSSNQAACLQRELLQARGADEKAAKRRKERHESSLSQLGFLGRAVFDAICTFIGSRVEQSHFKLLHEDDVFEIDWENREVVKKAIVEVRGKSYRVRLIVSEELGAPASR